MEMTFNENKSTWYRGTEFENSALVTSTSSNEALGIRSIKFTAPKQAQIDAGVIASVYVRLQHVGFAGTLWKGKDGKQFVRFTPEQRKTKAMVDGQEVVRNINLVALDACIEAQILRHAETFIKYDVAPSAETEAEAEALRKAEAERRALEDAKKLAELEAQMALLKSQQAPATETPVVSGVMNDMFAGGGSVSGPDDERPF